VFPSSFAVHRPLVLFDVFFRDGIEGVFGVRRLVNLGVVLVASLNDTLGSSTYENHLVARLRDVGVLEREKLLE